MKKLVGLLAVLISIQFAQATSLMGTSLQYENNSKAPGGVSHKLSVYMDGRVVHRRVSPQLPGGSIADLVTRLTVDQMEKINRLINLSTPVVPRFERSSIACFAPSSHIQNYTASNFTIFLKKGAACDGGYTVNVRSSARKLTRILDALENAAHSRMPSYEVENLVDAELAN